MFDYHDMLRLQHLTKLASPIRSVVTPSRTTIRTLATAAERRALRAGKQPGPSEAFVRDNRSRQWKRFLAITGGLAVTGSGLFFLLDSLEEHLMFYMTPTQVLERNPPLAPQKKFRLGGLVVEDSVKMSKGSLTIQFQVTDLTNVLSVRFKGVLPDLFKEGQSIVSEGYMTEDGYFHATEVLAKHDENYMPKDIKAIVDERKSNELAEGDKLAA